MTDYTQQDIDNAKEKVKADEAEVARLEQKQADELKQRAEEAQKEADEASRKANE